MQLSLPNEHGALQPYRLAHAASPFAHVAPARWNRSAYAAAHVVVDPLQPCDPWDGPPVIDWEATLRFREHLWRLGFKIAEAMDWTGRARVNSSAAASPMPGPFPVPISLAGSAPTS